MSPGGLGTSFSNEALKEGDVTVAVFADPSEDLPVYVGHVGLSFE